MGAPKLTKEQKKQLAKIVNLCRIYKDHRVKLEAHSRSDKPRTQEYKVRELELEAKVRDAENLYIGALNTLAEWLDYDDAHQDPMMFATWLTVTYNVEAK